MLRSVDVRNCACQECINVYEHLREHEAWRFRRGLGGRPDLMPAAVADYRFTVDPGRITLALDLRMLEGPEVDVALGVVEPTVDLWESGDLAPHLHDVGRLARLTRLLPQWFLKGPLPEMTNGWICGKDGCHHTGEPADVCPTCGRKR